MNTPNLEKKLRTNIEARTKSVTGTIIVTYLPKKSISTICFGTTVFGDLVL